MRKWWGQSWWSWPWWPLFQRCHSKVSLKGLEAERYSVHRVSGAPSGCPAFCPFELNKVCGSDGRTYDNECLLRAEACSSRIRITIQSQGSCDPQGDTRSGESCPTSCPSVRNEVCGNDGRTYDNECIMRLTACETGLTIVVQSLGQCSPQGSGQTGSECPTICPALFSPVCGSDGRTYDNECQMRARACSSNTMPNESKITVQAQGACLSQGGARTGESCPTLCPSLFSQVCGSDGNTYDNECQMRARACTTGTTITKQSNGPCLQRGSSNGCPSFCPFTLKQVCGSDGVTYGNECRLRANACSTGKSIAVMRNGPCSNARAQSKNTLLYQTHLFYIQNVLL